MEKEFIYWRVCLEDPGDGFSYKSCLFARADGIDSVSGISLAKQIYLTLVGVGRGRWRDPHSSAVV